MTVIFYYVFLKLLLDWPASLLTWDILFLIPVPWLGPVLAPCIVSLTMIALTASIIVLQEKGYDVTFKPKEFVLQILGCLIIIGSFIWDYLQTILNTHAATQIWTLSSKKSLLADMTSYIPESYNWWIFGIGEALLLYGIMSFIIRVKKGKVNTNNLTWFA